MRYLKSLSIAILLLAFAIPVHGQGFTADFSLPSFNASQVQPQLGVTAEAYNVTVTGAVGKRKLSGFVGTGLPVGQVGIFDAYLRFAPGVTRATSLDGASAYTAAGQTLLSFEGPNTRFGVGLRYDTPIQSERRRGNHTRVVISFGPSF